jgi:hypothetical protein
MILPNVNRRIIETIDQSKYPEDIKKMLKSLLTIELRNSQNRSSLFSRDYDRIISEISERRAKEGEI